jgi:long-chain acyl-CoA synthetase
MELLMKVLKRILAAAAVLCLLMTLVPAAFAADDARFQDRTWEDITLEFLGRVGATETGTICIGYYKNPEASANAFTDDGFLKTGDLGIMDKDGNVFIKGRSKSMILTANGQNVYPEEVEAIINDQPFVAESLVVDRASHIVALVYFDQDAVRKEGLDAEAVADLPEKVRTSANRRLASYSQIAKVEVQEVPFEKTPKMSIKRFLYK